jgi:hypothetical protein
MKAIGLSTDQLCQLRQCAAALPIELRTDLLKLVMSHMQLEGDCTDGAFSRALRWAVAQLPAGAGSGTCSCSR